jgi:Leucine-rich repeat (LRR) protein
VGQVPTDLGNLLDLRWLGVGRNNLGSNSSKDLDFLTSLKNSTKLEMLDFSNNNFGGSLPNSIGNLSMQLSALYLDGNQLSGIILAGLEKFINLTSLSMANNLFTSSIPAYFMKFQKLEGLALDGNRLSGHIPSSIGNLTQLVKLYL